MPGDLNKTAAFWAGIEDGLEKCAQAKVRPPTPAKGVAAITKARQKTPKATLQPKAKPKKPSRELGLGEQTMTMGDVKQSKRPLTQPRKPPRY